jgi:ankyrin repeat protein
MSRLLIAFLALISFSGNSFAQDVFKNYKRDISAPENLILAIVNEDTKKISKYLDHSRDLNYQFIGYIQTYYRNPYGQRKKDKTYLNGWTPLIAALKTKNIELVQKLLERKVNVNLVTLKHINSHYSYFPEGSSAMHAAAAISAYDSLVQMHNLGGNLSLKNAKGETPFNRYGMNGDLDEWNGYKTLEYLLEQSSDQDLNEMSQVGELPGFFNKLYSEGNLYSSNILFKLIDQLNWCRANDHRILLLKKHIQKFSLNAQNKQGLSAIHYALHQGACSPKIISFLLENGADPCLKDMNEKRAIDLIQYKYSINPFNYKLMLEDAEKILKDKCL